MFDRHPGARVILGHIGESLPFQRSRLDSRYRTPHAGAIAEVGADAVMFPVGYPYESTAEAIGEFEKTELSDTDQAKVAHENAERILKL